MHLQRIRPPSPPRQKKTQDTAVNSKVLEKFQFRAEDDGLFDRLKEVVPEKTAPEKKEKSIIDLKKIRNRKKYEYIDDLFGGIDIRKDNLQSPVNEIKYENPSTKPKPKEFRSKEVKVHDRNDQFNEDRSRTNDKSIKIGRVVEDKQPPKSQNRQSSVVKKLPSNVKKSPNNVKMPPNNVKRPSSNIKISAPAPKKVPLKQFSSLKSKNVNLIRKGNKILKVKEYESESESDSESEDSRSEEYSEENDSGSDVEDKMDYYKNNYSDIIKKTFGYDRSDPKYLIRDRMRLEADVNNFEEISREERKSTKIGQMEDKQERLKAEMRKKKRKGLKS